MHWIRRKNVVEVNKPKATEEKKNTTCGKRNETTLLSQLNPGKSPATAKECAGVWAAVAK